VWSDEAQQAEALQMLTAILQFEHQQQQQSASDRRRDDDDDVNQCSEYIARVCHSLAIIHYLLHDTDKVIDHNCHRYHPTICHHQTTGSYP